MNHKTYTQKDLGEALAGVPVGLSPLDVDKYWAERQVSEEWARMEDEGPCLLPTADPRTIQNELSALRSTRLPKTGSCHEL